MSTQVHATALIEDGVSLGDRVKVWHGSHLRSGVQIGSDVIIGRNVYIGNSVIIGANSKIQNNALIYEPAILGAGVFVGPGVILTNDHNPRAITVSGEVKGASDWEAVGVQIGDGASIGAGSVCIAPVAIGRWAMVGAGSVVTKKVEDYALVVGNPARQIGWVGEAGQKLELRNESWICPQTKSVYEVVNGKLAKVNEN